MNARILELLYRSFDGHLMKAERDQLDNALARSGELRREKQQLISMRERIKEDGTTTFKPFFSSRVMNRLKADRAEETEFFRSLLWSFRVVGLAGVFAILVTIASTALEEKSLSLDILLAVPHIEIEQTWELDDFLEI